jgi:hypothetical protein
MIEPKFKLTGPKLTASKQAISNAAAALAVICQRHTRSI